jgi:hypothetical protein
MRRTMSRKIMRRRRRSRRMRMMKTRISLLGSLQKTINLRKLRGSETIDLRFMKKRRKFSLSSTIWSSKGSDLRLRKE